MNKHTAQYTDEELAILDYIENEQPGSVPDVEREKAKYQQIFKQNVSARKQVSLRLLERDLHKLKTSALVQGIPYQTLISSVLHQYVNNQLVHKGN